MQDKSARTVSLKSEINELTNRQDTESLVSISVSTTLHHFARATRAPATSTTNATTPFANSTLRFRGNIRAHALFPTHTHEKSRIKSTNVLRGNALSDASRGTMRNTNRMRLSWSSAKHNSTPSNNGNCTKKKQQ